MKTIQKTMSVFVRNLLPILLMFFSCAKVNGIVAVVDMSPEARENRYLCCKYLTIVGIGVGAIAGDALALSDIAQNSYDNSNDPGSGLLIWSLIGKVGWGGFQVLQMRKDMEGCKTPVWSAKKTSVEVVRLISLFASIGFDIWSISKDEFHTRELALAIGFACVHILSTLASQFIQTPPTQPSEIEIPIN